RPLLPAAPREPHSSPTRRSSDLEAALDHQPLDLAPRVARARLGHRLGVGVGDARGQGDRLGAGVEAHELRVRAAVLAAVPDLLLDRKSTRLNSSHVKISYAVFCL